MFAALDFVVFYVFYEATLIPSSLLIGIWGGPKRVFASLKFFLFTFGGSLFMLIALIAMWQIAGTTDIPTLLATHFTPHAQGWMFLCFLLAFGVKLPVFPLHGWLPDAYAEGPAPATALIAGVLSKAGAYGFLRFAISMLPDASHRAAPWMIALGIIAVIYAAAVALAQTDMKRMIAYSSFSHMGLVLVGLFTLNAPGVAGRGVPDAQPRHHHRRPVLRRRHVVEPGRHRRDRGLRRSRAPDAEARHACDAVRDGQHRPARNRRLRR